MLRCKFAIAHISRRLGGRGLTLTAVTGEENKQWAAYTPSGSMELTINNPNAFPLIDALNPGDEMFIDLALVPKPTPKPN
jgi:hypothetical protein